MDLGSGLVCEGEGAMVLFMTSAMMVQRPFFWREMRTKMVSLKNFLLHAFRDTCCPFLAFE